MGSCTDLVATVTLPLAHIYKKGFVMAPYAVLVDPFRAERVLGLAEGGLWRRRAAETRAAHEESTAGSAGASGHRRGDGKKRKSLAAKESGGKGRGRSVAATYGGKSASTTGGGFSDDVNYIYRKQLEEVEIIVINKFDLMSDERRARLGAALAVEFPDARIMETASREGAGLDPLFEKLATETGRTRHVMDVDYTRYGVGEARLGWVNVRCELRVEGGKKPAGAPPAPLAVDGNAWLGAVAERVRVALKKRKIEVAHFKMTLAGGTKRARGPAIDAAGLAAVNLVGSDAAPEFSHRLTKPITQGSLLVNLRAEADPDVLAPMVLDALVRTIDTMPGLAIEELHSQHFKPGQPEPTHRVAAVG